MSRKAGGHGNKNHGNKFLGYGPLAESPPARTKKYDRSNLVPAQARLFWGSTRRPRHSAEEFIPTAFWSIFVLLLPVALLPSVSAQNEVPKAASKPKIGQVDIDFQKSAGTSSLLHLMGRVKMTSEDYDLNAEDIKITFNPTSGKTGKKGAAALKQAVADGVPGKQVIAHIRRPLDSQDYTIYADQAVYVPVTTRPSGGKIDFTGHVQVITNSGFLAIPSVSTFESATVLLGVGSDYPQVITGAGHITLTPAQ